MTGTTAQMQSDMSTPLLNPLEMDEQQDDAEDLEMNASNPLVMGSGAQTPDDGGLNAS